MTAQNDFKKLVRDRMAKTGESYTSARAALFLKSGGHRKCKTCGSLYSPDEAASSWPHYFDAPYLYSQGVNDHCLACWLGVGPHDR
jgi:hypothetical protein